MNEVWLAAPCVCLSVTDESGDEGERVPTPDSYQDLCAAVLGRALSLTLAVNTYWAGMPATALCYIVKL